MPEWRRAINITYTSQDQLASIFNACWRKDHKSDLVACGYTDRQSFKTDAHALGIVAFILASVS